MNGEVNMAGKILVVDDEPDILKMVTFRLKKEGYEVITAKDGQEALDLINRERPDLVLLDLRLPVMDGYEVCKRLKTDKNLKQIPVVFLTASVTSSIAEKVKAFNADSYLIKPFDPVKLLETVKKFIK